MLQLFVIIGFVAALIIRLRSRRAGTRPDTESPPPKKPYLHNDPAYRYVPKQKHHATDKKGAETGMVLAAWVWKIGAFLTFVALIALDAEDRTQGAEWLVAVPINALLGAIWPIYWGILHWVM
tara:strand:- start:1 stop:369 length:369 start_codon:yes stop_codon:yes gene_type:complete